MSNKHEREASPDKWELKLAQCSRGSDRHPVHRLERLGDVDHPPTMIPVPAAAPRRFFLSTASPISRFEETPPPADEEESDMNIVDFAKAAKKGKVSISTLLSRLSNAPDAECDAGDAIDWTLEKSPSSSGSDTEPST